MAPPSTLKGNKTRIGANTVGGGVGALLVWLVNLLDDGKLKTGLLCSIPSIALFIRSISTWGWNHAKLFYVDLRKNQAYKKAQALIDKNLKDDNISNKHRTNLLKKKEILQTQQVDDYMARVEQTRMISNTISND